METDPMTLIKTLTATLLTAVLFSCSTLPKNNKPPVIDESKLLFQADFSRLDEQLWKVEMESKGQSNVRAADNQLILNTFGGVTVWLNKPLTGDYIIRYKRGFFLNGDVNDRLSDLNQFWLAFDPHNASLFTRSGALAEYDNLNLFYMGIGGNYNGTTRFRWYDGTGERRLLQEYLTSDYLLQDALEYEVITEVKNRHTRVWVNGKLFFDSKIHHEHEFGYFGFRSTYSHQYIKDFSIYRY